MVFRYDLIMISETVAGVNLPMPKEYHAVTMPKLHQTMPKLLRRWQPMRMGRPLPAFVWIFSKNESILE
jgi:hypothetical protein